MRVISFFFFFFFAWMFLLLQLSVCLSHQPPTD